MPFFVGNTISDAVVFDLVGHVIRPPSLMTAKQSTSRLSQGQHGRRSELLGLLTIRGTIKDKSISANRHFIVNRSKRPKERPPSGQRPETG